MPGTLRTVTRLGVEAPPKLSVATKFLGDLEYTSEDLFSFPAGLPGFESYTDFLFLNIPEVAPLLFLQCVSTRNLCFVLLPILTLAPGFRLNLTAEERHELGLGNNTRPALGRDVLCAAMISAPGDGMPLANLMAPVVVNLRTRVGLQVIHPESGYSHQHPIVPEKLALAC